MGEELFQRVEMLEASNRRLKRLLLVAVLVVGCGALVAAYRPQDKVLDANKIILRDKKGVIRADFQVKDENDSVILRFLNADEKPGLVLYSSPSGRALTLWDWENGESCSIDISQFGPSLSMMRNRRPVISLGAGRNPSTTALYIRESQGKAGADLTISDDNGPALTLTDRYGKPRLINRLLDGLPSISLLDSAKVPRLMLGVERGTPEIIKLDKTGKKVTWAAP